MVLVHHLLQYTDGHATEYFQHLDGYDTSARINPDEQTFKNTHINDIIEHLSLKSRDCTLITGSFLFKNKVEAVERGNFKTCNEASFCKRLRGKGGELQSQYALSPNSLQINESSGIITALIVKQNLEALNDTSKLRLELYTLDDGIIRIKINEVNPIKERFEVPLALVDDIPTRIQFKILSSTEHALIIQIGNDESDTNNQIVLTYEPFIVDFYMANQLIASANSRGLLEFERMRNKSEKEEWEETFNGHRDSRPYGPTAIGMDISFRNFGHIFGIPEHADNFSLEDTSNGNGEPYRLYNLDVNHYELNERMALYASVPFVMAHKEDASVGLFWLNAAETWIDVSKFTTGSEDTRDAWGSLDFGSSKANVSKVETHWMSESGIIDTFILLGKTPKEVSRKYGKLTGVTPLPPLFALGYHQSKWNYKNEADVTDVNARFDENRIPADSIWLDIEHTDGKRYFTWNPVNFSTPTEMINNVASSGRKMVTIVDPHIKVDENYYVFKNGLEDDIFVKNLDESNFKGWCWPGDSVYINFLQPNARNFIAEQYKLENYKGSTLDLFTWNDMNEPSVFNGPEMTMQKDLIHNNGKWEHRDVHNLYGLANAMSTYAGHLLRSKNELRPFILSRSGFAGTQRYAAIWTGDNAAEWSHLKATIASITR